MLGFDRSAVVLMMGRGGRGWFRALKGGVKEIGLGTEARLYCASRRRAGKMRGRHWIRMCVGIGEG